MFKPDFEGIPKNPIREYREHSRHNIADFSRRVDVDTQVIRDLESGIPKTIPTRIKTFFTSIVSPEILDRQYNEWRQIKRSRVYLPPVGILSVSSDIHPFAQYRAKLKVEKVTTLCEYLCIPRFVIMNWEEKQFRMPKLLREVLPQVHLKIQDVDKLGTLGEIYYSAREQRRINEQQRIHGHG